MSEGPHTSTSTLSSSDFSAHSSPIVEDDESTCSSVSCIYCPSPGYTAAVNKCLQTLKSDGLFSDITLKVGDKRIKCHKVILCTFSGYFKSMFQSGMKESKQSEVILEMLDPAAVEAVINYMYTDDIGITESNAEDILITVLYLQIESLKEKCEEAIKSFVTPDSLFTVWKLSDTYSECKALQKYCVQYALNNFKKISQSTNFVEIDLQNLTYLLSNDKLKVSNENVVLLGVMKWIRHDRSSRISTLNNILPYIRMPLVSGVEIDKLKKEFPEVMEEFVLPYIQEAETYNRDIARQMSVSSLRSEYRRYHKKEKVLLIISGCRMYYRRVRTMWCYSYYNNTWSKLAPVPETPEFEFSTCTIGESDLYMTVCGQSFLLFNYSGLTNKWKICSSITRGRYFHNMLAVQNSIYLIGGYEHFPGSLGRQLCKKIDAYDVCDELCREVGELHTPILSCISVVGQSNKIYIFGGRSNLEGRRSNIVQCFDTNTSTCSVITTDPGIKWVLGATSCNGNIIVADGENIYNFITDDNKFKKIGQRTNVLQGMGMIQKESKIIFVGGEGRDVYSPSRTLVQHDLNTSTESVWDISLPERLSGFECHHFIVKKSILLSCLTRYSHTCDRYISVRDKNYPLDFH